jgi:hypothetical protein
MKRFILFMSICLFTVAACVSRQETPPPLEPVQAAQPAAPVEPPLRPVPAAPEPSSFDYEHITEDVHAHTRAEIQQLIRELDTIIRNEDYRAWIGHLDASYLEKISSADFLAAQSQSPRLKSQEGLKSAKEYFIKVVVPSRANTSYQIGDIDIQFFPEEKLVLAFLPTSAGRRLRLYELKNVEGVWKIIN